MENVKRAGFAAPKSVGHPMHKQRSPILPDDAVAAAIRVAGPQPATTIQFRLYATLKPIFEWFHAADGAA